MKPLDLQSEEFSPTGNLVAEGVLNTLGRPDMSPLALLVREAVQNSWDAKIGAEPVQFSVFGWELMEKQRKVYGELIFKDHRAVPALQGSLGQARKLRVLAFADRNTAGLAGPTRADMLSPSDPERNFVSFFRNVGRARPDKPGGGTYGYGKAALYICSKARTICAYTRCRSGRSHESRFMAAALGEQHEGAGARRPLLTGRHWWGREGRGGVVDPVVGVDADYLAEAIGIPTLNGPHTGTTILIVDPWFGNEQDPENAMDKIVRALLYYCWPKMIRDRGKQPPMIFSAKWAGHDFPIPDPERSEQLRGFVLAYRQLKLKLEGGEPDKAQVDTVSTLRPRADLGLLSLTHANVPPAKVRLDEEDEEEDVVPDISHHVALMREPELVVNYHAGPSMPVSGVGYAGVFRAADELNGHFAAAERPTHDGWNPNLLEDDNARRNVRIALERISERLRVFIEPYGQTPTSDATARLASFARIMGSLIPTSDGPGAEVQPLRQTSTGGKSASRRPATVVPLGTPETLEIGGRLVTRIWFRIEHALTDGTTTIEVKPSIGVLDGATRESAPPLGEETPEVLCWRSKSGHAVATGCAKYVMPTSDEDRWGVDIFTPRNSLLLVDMRAESSSE